MTCLECGHDVAKADAIPEDVRPDGTLPKYGTCRTCRQGRGRQRGVRGVSRLSAPEQALYGRETQRRTVVIARA